MSIIQWNCRGITSSAEELKSLFRESEVKDNVFTGDQTWEQTL